MKVGIVIKDFSLGGGPRAVLHLCMSLPEVNFVIFGRIGVLQQEFKNLPNVELIFINKWNFCGIRTVLDAIKKMDIQIIHCHNLFPGVMFAFCSASLPRIFTFHGLHIKKYLYQFNPLFKLVRLFIKYIILKTFNVVIVLSENDKKFLSRLFPKYFRKIEVIPNCIDSYEINLLAKQKHVLLDKNYYNVLMVARYDFAKGYDVLFKNLKKVLDAIPSVKFYFIGDERVKRLTENVSSERVQYLANTTQPYCYMKEVDLLILPSRWEGLPMVVLEAISLGTRVLISNNCNLHEDGRNVFVFDFFDYSEFISKLKKCIEIKDIPVTYDMSQYQPKVVSNAMYTIYTKNISNGKEYC